MTLEGLTEDQIDRMAEAFYERGRQMDGRYFLYRHDNPAKCLSEKTREHYKERMRAAVAVLEETK